MKNLEKLTNIIESILFVSGVQVAISDISEKLEVSEKDVLKAYEVLKEKYSGESGLQILLFNKKLQFCSNPNYSEQVSSVLNPIRERELSRALLEVAAIIAYKQPITRIDIAELRGGNSDYAVQKLLELNMIEPVGRKDAVGKPVLFGTTDNFLKRFQISSLDDLPDYDELINKIALIHQSDNNDDYLYTKDVYIEEQALTEDKATINTAQPTANTLNKNQDNNIDSFNDFDLPSFEDEEIPEFLQDEEVDKI